MHARPACLLALAVWAGAALAQAETTPHVLALQSYEPNTIGFTWDSDDVRFLDFKLSVKYPVMPGFICKADVLHDSLLYFAATARFAQYLGTRASSPVLGKRFNPKLIWRQLTGPGTSTDQACYRNALAGTAPEYFDFSFGHESNGQSINSPELFNDAAQRAERPEFARDNISRGWDYLEIVRKQPLHPDGPHELKAYITLKYFLPRGPLQGAAEEYNAWENDPEGKPRRQVHGVGLLVRYDNHWERYNWIKHPKVTLGYETGYSRIFRYNTLRAEAGIKLFELPVSAFYQYGYGSDLALYYKKVRSLGFYLEIASF